MSEDHQRKINHRDTEDTEKKNKMEKIILAMENGIHSGGK